VHADIKERIKPRLEDCRGQLTKLLEDLAKSSSGGAACLEGFAISLVATFVKGPTESAKVNFIPVHQEFMFIIGMAARRV